MAQFVLTVYGDDGVTPLFEVGTDAGHTNPYLHMPDEFGESDVDLLRGKAQIGQINVRVIDPQTGATQADRFLTALLGNASGYSALNRRRAKLAHATGEIVMDGVVGGVTLNDTFAGFTLPIRDVRERGRKVPCFNWTTSCTAFPRGVKDGYGALPGGGWLKEPTTPATGTYHGTSTGGYIKTDLGWPIANARYVLSDTAREAMQHKGRNAAGRVIYDRIVVRWRAVGSGTWNTITGLRTSGIASGVLTPDGYASEIFETANRVVVNKQGQRVEGVPCLSRLYLNQGTDAATLPTDEQDVEFIVDYVGPVSEQWPFHFEGPWGEAVAHLLDGDWSFDDQGETIDPRIRYDATAVAAVTKPVSIRLTEAREDVREALEQMCGGALAAPALDADGEIAPIVWRLPDTSEVLPQIDDTNAVAIAGWEHPADTAITAVEVRYRRVFSVDSFDGAGDGLTSREVIVRHRAPDAVLDVMGEQDVLKVDGWMLTAIGGPDGEPATADVVDEIGHQQAQEIAHAALDRSVYGQQSSFVRLMASDFPGLAPGDWVTDARSWVPNYATGTRGGNSLAQVASVQRRHAWLDCRLVHSGPADALLAVPTFDTPSETDGVVTVTALTASADVEVQYAVNATEPAANSGLWTFMGRRTGAGDIDSPEFASGVTVWLRGRSVGRGRRPSTWVSIGSAVAGAVPRVRTLTATLQDDGAVLVEWDVNDATAGLRLYYEAHAADVTPGMASYVDVDASAGEYTFAASIVGRASFTIEAEPYPAFPISGTPGEKVARSLSARPNRDPFGTVSAYVDETGALYFDAHGNEDGVSFRWAASKTALPSTPSGTVNARESLGVDSGLTLAEGETGYVAVWWYSDASGGGVQGRRVGAQTTREGSTSTPTVIRIREYQWRFTFGGSVDRYLDLTLSYDASVESITIIYSDASDPSPEPSIGATYTFNVPSPGPTAIVETVKQSDGTTEQTWDLTVRPDVLIAIHAFDGPNGTGNEVGGDQLIARQDAGTQPVIVGGTGKTELAAGSIIVGEGTDPVTELTGTSAGQVARWNGTRFVADDVGWSDIASVPSSFTPSAHAASHASGGTDALSLAASQITTGQFANARISQSSVVQHQAALSIAPSQLSGEVTPDKGGTGLSLDTSTPDSLLLWDQSAEAFDPQTLSGSGYLRWNAGSLSVASIPGTVESAPGEGRAYVSTGSGVSAHGWSTYTVPTAAQWSAADVGAPLVRTAQGYAFGELPWSFIEAATIPVYATRWPTPAEIGAAASGHSHTDYALAAVSGHQPQYMVRSLDGTTNANYGRSVDRPTSDYSKAFGLEFKSRVAIGAPGAGTYVGVLTMAAYSDSSGGATHGQIAFNHTDISFRAGVFGSAWSGWEQFAFRSWVTNVLGQYVAKSDIITPAQGGFGIDISGHPANSIYLWDGSAFDRQTLGGTGFLHYSGGSLSVQNPSGTVASAPGEGRIYVSTGSGASAHGWSVYTWPTASAVNLANGGELLRLNGAQTGFELHALTPSDLPAHPHSWSQITGGVAEFSSTGESYRVGSRMRVYTADSGYAHIGHWLGHDGTDHVNTHPSLPGAAFRYTGSGGFAWRVATTTGEGPVSLATRWQVSADGELEVGTIPASRVIAGTFGSGTHIFPDFVRVLAGASNVLTGGVGALALKSFLSFHAFADGARIGFIHAESSGAFRIRSEVTGRDIIFDAESAERLRILAGGGIAVPQNQAVYLDGGSNTYIQSNSADRVRVVTGGSERFQVNNSGAGFAVALAVPGLTVSGNAVVTGTLTAAGGFDSTVVSLRKYKDGIEDFPLDRAALMALQPRQWTHSVLAPDHLRGRWGAGFVEDEAPDIFRDRGRGYRHTHITAQLVAYAQDNERWKETTDQRVARLEAENADLRQQLAALN